MQDDRMQNFTGADEELDLKRYLFLFYKKRWTFISITALVMAITLIYTFKQTPIYRSTAVLLIESPSSGLSLSATRKTKLAPRIGGDEYYKTQYSILESMMLAKRVCAGLDSPLTPAALIGMTTIQPVRKTRLVQVSIDHPDPAIATHIANTMVRLYIEQNIESLLFMSKEVFKAFPDAAEEIGRSTIYGQLQELSREEAIESLPAIALDPLLQNLKSERIRTKTQIANLSKRYKEKHPKMVPLMSELAFIDKTIIAETDKILRSLKADLAGHLQANNIRVIDYAEQPTIPIKPQKTKNIMYGLLLSMVLGTGLVLFMEYMDDTLKNQEDVETKLGMPYLGYFPPMRRLSPLITVNEFTKINNQADVSIAIDNIKTNIIFSAPKEALKSLVFTSTIPREGKSFLASFVAYTFAKGGLRTLIIDCDLRRPNVHKMFSIERESGLTNVLVEDADPEAVIKKSSHDNLYVMASGSKTPNPLELLSSPKMREVLDGLLHKFDKVIVDAPPSLLLPDAMILSRICNATIFIAKSGAISKDAFSKLKKRFSSEDSKIIGVILNFFDMGKHSQYKHNYYYSHYKDYYAKSK